jgi:hypothetical protein
MTIQEREPITVNGRLGYKKGWRKIRRHVQEVDVRQRLYRVIDDPSFSESVKGQARQFLNTIVDDKMPSAIYREACKFARDNKIPNKEERRRLELRETAESHAVFLACQACDNLRDRNIKVNSSHEKAKMVMQVASAINALSELQVQLIGGNDDDQG